VVTTILFITLVGAFWLVGGLFSLGGLAVDKTNRGWKIFLAVLNIIAGIVILAYPLISTIFVLAFFIIFVGFWGCLIGFAHLFQAFATKDAGAGILGIVSLIFGLLLLAYPLYAAALLPFIAGIFAIVGGIASVATAFMAKKLQAMPGA
jgi:uncharacterized membrane protein HdeD (DUF308 family)